MPRKKKPTPNSPLSAYPLPEGVELTPAAQEEWARFTRALPLNTGPRMLFVVVDSPVLRRRLAEHLAAALRADSHIVARIDFTAAYYRPLLEIFDAAAKHPDARFCFLFGLERSLISAEHRWNALTDLNLHRDQIQRRLTCPLVIWITDDTFTDLVCNAPDFIAWRGGVFTFADPSAAIEAPYRQYIIDRHGKLTLYSVTSDAPLAVDLERVFVKFTATQRQMMVRPDPWEVMAPESWEGEAPAEPVGIDEGSVGASLPSASLREGKASAAPFTIGSAGASPFRLDSTEETTVTLSITGALRAHSCLLIIGAPGAGKTTLLKYLALTFARHQAKERLELDEARLPIFISLRDFNRFLDDKSKTHSHSEPISPQLLPEFLNEHIKRIAPHLNLPDDFFSRQLDAGNCIVLLDGLDEVADPLKRAGVAEAVAAFVRPSPPAPPNPPAPFPGGRGGSSPLPSRGGEGGEVVRGGNRFVITSRPRGYEGEAKQRLSSLCADCTIRDFDEDDMAAFVRSWYTAVTVDQQGDTPTARDIAAARADDLLRAIRADARVKALAHNPLLLSVLAMVHQRGVGLPQRRAELYDECIDMLLGYWDQTKGGEAARELATYGGLNRSEKRSLLEPVALWFHERGEQGLEADKEDLEREITRQFQETFGDDERKAKRRAELFLRVIEERAGLLVERETDVYAFAHLTFQEYLAARAIADRDDYIEYTLRHRHDPWWREVILLEVGHLNDVRHFGRRARKLTSDLIRALRSAGSWLEDVLKRDLFFAARCLCDTGTLGVDDELRRAIMDELIALWRTTPYFDQRAEIANLFADYIGTVNEEHIVEKLLHAIGDEDLRVRADAAEALGKMGEKVAGERVLDALLQALRDGDASVCIWDEHVNVRAAAAEALGRMGKGAATGQVLEALNNAWSDAIWGVREKVVEALGRIGEQAATEQVLKILFKVFSRDEEEIAVAVEAAWAFERMIEGTARERVLDALIKALGDEDPVMRSRAAWIFGEMREVSATAEVLAAMLTVLHDENTSVRYQAVCAIERMGEGAVTESVMAALVKALGDEDADVRAMAAQTLGNMGEGAATDEVLEALRKALTDEAPLVRYRAAHALEELRKGAAREQVLDALLYALSAEDPYARYDAAWALGVIGEEAATEPVLAALVKALGDEGEEGSISYQAAMTFGLIGKGAARERVLGVLRKALDDENANVRSGAVDAFGEVGEGSATKEVLDALMHALGDKNPKVRAMAAQAFGKVGEGAATEEVLTALIKVLGDEDPNVRAMTAEALGRIGKSAATKGVLAALLKTLSDKDINVCVNAALAFGQMGSEVGAATTDITAQLASFWQSQLENTESCVISGAYNRPSDIAYAKLQQIAARVNRKLGVSAPHF